MSTHTAADGPTDDLRCVIVTPEHTALDERVDFVALPLFDGEVGILPGRAPLIGRLGYGELRVNSGGGTSRYFVDGGFVQVRDNVVTVLTARAVDAIEVDTQLAAKELEQAQAKVATTDVGQAEKDRTIARARAQLRVASRAR